MAIKKIVDESVLKKLPDDMHKRFKQLSVDDHNAVLEQARSYADAQIIPFSKAIIEIMTAMPVSASLAEIPKDPSKERNAQRGKVKQEVISIIEREVRDELSEKAKTQYDALNKFDRRTILAAAHSRTITSIGSFSHQVMAILEELATAPNRTDYMSALTEKNKSSNPRRAGKGLSTLDRLLAIQGASSTR